MELTLSYSQIKSLIRLLSQFDRRLGGDSAMIKYYDDGSKISWDQGKPDSSIIIHIPNEKAIK